MMKALPLLLLLGTPAFAIEVYVTRNVTQADVKAVTVKSPAQANCKVFFVRSAPQATKPGLWHLVDNPQLADLRVFLTRSSVQAELKVYVVDSSTQARCKY